MTKEQCLIKFVILNLDDKALTHLYWAMKDAKVWKGSPDIRFIYNGDPGDLDLDDINSIISIICDELWNRGLASFTF